jgi:NADPH2:quinone reductase
MQAAFIERPGPAAAIRVGELPPPEAGDTDVLVRVAAVTVNPVDTYIRSGAYRTELPAPFIIGRDMTGTVEAVGSAVTRFRPGDRVWCNNQGYDGRQGTFAEQLAIAEPLLYHLPAAADPLEAVTVLHSGLTASIGLFARAGIAPGETVFVNGGDGNVGTAVLQFARTAGARVIVTAGRPEKAQWCRELGADEVIDYRRDRVVDAVRRTCPDGVHVYWDASGHVALDDVLAVMRRRGRIVLMAGLTHRTELAVGTFYTRNCSLYGFTVTDATREELAAHARRIADALANGTLRGRTHAVLPLSNAAEAHRLVEQGGLFGKIVLVPSGDRPGGDGKTP